MVENDNQDNLKQTPVHETAADVKKLLEGTFASGYNSVYVNSIGREIGFKEITVLQQKTLSRIMIGNEERKDVVYDAQCAIINETCLEQGFDIYRLTEFDRLKLLIALYQSNMTSNQVKFTCAECGTENTYTLDFGNTLKRLDAIDLSPKKFEYSNKNFNFVFHIQYPGVRRVSDFHKQYRLHHKGGSKRDARVNDSMSNMEYINLFISTVEISDKSGKQIKTIDFSMYQPSEIEDMLQVFPQDVLYTENGVLNFITTEYIQKLNESFDRHQCFSCGAFHEDEHSNRAEGFL